LFKHLKRLLCYTRTMLTILRWIYMLNAVLLIVHEVDSAYWREWELFKLPGKITFFLILHLFLVFLILLGLMFLFQNVTFGLIMSSILSMSGILAFSLHIFFIRKGRAEFKTPISLSILTATLLASIAQMALTVYLFLPGNLD
jgi:hypothetical protein